MNIHQTLNSICARTSFLLDIETCFIANHIQDDDWKMIAGHGILSAPHAFSLSSKLNPTDRGLNVVHGTCTLKFQQAFNTTIEFEFLAKQGHNISLFIGSRVPQSALGSDDIRLLGVQYKLMQKEISRVSTWLTTPPSPTH